MNIKKLKEKFKSVKNIELWLALIVGAVLVIVVFATSAKVDKTVQDTTQFDEYIASMENKICSVIQKMQGCQNVRVAISYSATDEKLYAYDSEKVTENGVVTETNSVVLVNGKPLVLAELPPTICGVVVIADGADDAVVKLQIKQVVVTLLDVSVDKVQVFTYKS